VSAEALRRSLAAIGVDGHVEGRDRLAVLTLNDPGVLRDASLRRRALLLAREHGFTNFALEIGAEARATVSRD